MYTQKRRSEPWRFHQSRFRVAAEQLSHHVGRGRIVARASDEERHHGDHVVLVIKECCRPGAVRGFYEIEVGVTHWTSATPNSSPSLDSTSMSG
jgi:hypothetical protein